MLNYYLRLALLSLKRNSMLTGLVVLAISLGVALTMAAYSVLYVMSRNPIPDKSNQLFAVQIDNGGPASRQAGSNEPPSQLSYRDSIALLKAHRAKRQVAMHQVSLTLTPHDSNLHPWVIAARATSGDFFAMFEVPMLYGSSWTASAERDMDPVVVLSKRLNQRLFQGANSVGRSVVLDGISYRVSGVIDDWDPKPRFYDVIGGLNFEEGEEAYLPLSLTIEKGMSTSEFEYCYAGPRGRTFADLLQSECVWLQFWVELPSPGDELQYRTFLTNYAESQRDAGRFHWQPNVRLRNVQDWLVSQKVVPNDARLSLLVACSFFVVCLVSAMGLMLSKAFSRSGELGIRRALGASERDIFVQVIVESGVVGIIGGALGLCLTLLGLWTIRQLFPEGMSRIAQLNLELAAATILLAFIASVAVGLYPAWRSMRVAPALQIKGG
jgi:putative ABC transport system permease protein